MKILYAIQGTGNGHLSRAREIVPILQKEGELDILVSGTQSDIDLPYPVKYRFGGLSFVFGTGGGVDILKTYKNSNVRRLFKEIESVPVQQYDVIINDFEPVSAWACYLKNKHCIALSHQAAVLNKKAPQPEHRDLFGKALLKNYAPATAHYGFHFKAYEKNIFTPVIRNEIRELEPENEGHYTVYLPAYHDDQIIHVLNRIRDIKWEVFSKHTKRYARHKNIFLYPISNDAFIKSMGAAEGILCGAGFETPAEALFLQKKLMVIPMKAQFEQHCNATSLAAMGVPVLKSMKTKHTDKIQAWIQKGTTPSVVYPNITREIIVMILQRHVPEVRPMMLGKKINSEKEFSKTILKKILSDGMHIMSASRSLTSDVAKVINSP